MEEGLFLLYNATFTKDFSPTSRSSSNSTRSSNYTIADFKTLNTASIFSITVYSVLLFFGLIGNLVVFLTLLKSRYRKSSRVNKLILHLAIADLIVCCFTIPIEIGWRVTVTWEAGDFFCRILQFSRPFGLYLSSNTIICISLDRYFAIVQPLKLADARRRGRVMLAGAWIFAVISSIPQAIIFHATSGELEELPGVIISDCVSTGYFEPVYEAAYSICSICIMYVMPLVVTVGAYGRILWEISITRRLKATSQNNPDPSTGSFLSQQEKSTCGGPLTGGQRGYDRSASVMSSNRIRQPANNNSTTARQADLSKIERARSRTLKLTVLIVSVFIVCFTPYAVLVFWYQVDKKSALLLDQTLQESLFLFAVSNSILNPYLYGIYSKNLRKEICRSFIWHAIRDFFSKNVCGDSSFSGGLARRWTKGTDGVHKEKGTVRHPLQWTPPPTPLTAYKLSASNRALQTGPGRYSALNLTPCEPLITAGSKDPYCSNFAAVPLPPHHHVHHQPYLPQEESSRKSLVSNQSGTGTKNALRGTAVACKKTAKCAKTRIYDDAHSAASSFD